MRCPYDFGFVPSTLADDGDPLDVLGPHGHAGDPGVRDQGATNRRHRSEAEAKGEDWERNDRLVVVTVQRRGQ